MAFKSRNNKSRNKNLSVVREDEKVVTSQTVTALDSSNTKIVAKTKFQKEHDAFKAKACKILDILEHEHGVDFYDENRTPGMYLDRKSNEFQKIKKIKNNKNNNSEKKADENNLLSQLFGNN